MKKITKKSNKQFIREMTEFVRGYDVNNTERDHHRARYEFDVPTRHGTVSISIDDDNIHCFTVYTRFHDVAEGYRLTGVSNPHSGKFNTHISGAATVDDAVFAAKRHLRTFLPDPPLPPSKFRVKRTMMWGGKVVDVVEAFLYEPADLDDAKRKVDALNAEGKTWWGPNDEAIPYHYTLVRCIIKNKTV